MAINASAGSSTPRELIPAGMYVARCYKMVYLGMIEEETQWGLKKMPKVIITWELPNEKKSFKEGEEPKPLVISMEFTLSLADKAKLRNYLNSWRGKPFTDAEAKKFDITKLLGQPCLLNITHNTGKKDPSKTYEFIATITPLMKGQECPAQINETFEFNFEEAFSWEKFNSFPDFIKDKIKKSDEYGKLEVPASNPATGVVSTENTATPDIAVPF